MHVLILCPDWPGREAVSSTRIVTAVTGGAPQQNEGALNIVTATRLAGHEAEYFQAPYHGTISDAIDRIGQADVLGLSLMQWNTPTGLEIARAAKARNPRIQVAVGGVSPSCNPDCYRRPEVDAIFVGEAEETFPAWLGNGLPAGMFTGRRIQDWGKYSGEVDPIVLNQLYFRGVGPAVHPWGFYSARGCRGSCIFCCTPMVFPGTEVHDSQVRERLLYLKNAEVGGIGVNNPTFNDEPEQARTFCQAIHDLDLPWTAMCSAHQEDLGLYEIMRRSGCFKVGFGIEEPTPGGRDKLNKRGRSTQHCLDSLRAANDAGLLVRGYFMIGAPWQGESDVEALVEMLSLGLIDEPRLSFLTPFWGTGLYSQLITEGHRLESNLDRYTTNHPVVNHPLWSMEEMVFRQRDIIHWFWVEGPGAAKVRSRIKDNKYHQLNTGGI